MVSLLDQYETEIRETNDTSDELNPFRTGFFQASLNPAENEEIFKSHRVQINLQGKSIDQFEKCSDQMVLLFKPKTIRLLHIENRTDEIIESTDPISRFFFDKTGKHLLVATETNELYYYSRQSKKLRAIKQLKGNAVTAVGWNKSMTEKNLESILVGTKKGVLYELVINPINESMLGSNVEYCKQVYNFGKETTIYGIEIIHLRKENKYSAPNIENIYDVMVATSNRLYEFIGNDSNAALQSSSSSSANNLLAASNNQSIFTSIFAYYESKNIHELANYLEMPGDIGYSQLQIRNNIKTRKRTLAWMTGGGVLVFEFDSFALAKFSAANFQNETIKRIINDTNHEVISYPQVKDDHMNHDADFPIGISLTEFHLAIFYTNQVKILCLLNKELVLNQKLDSKSIGGRTLGVWFDMNSGDFGSYTSQSIIKYVANKESRRIWKIYLSKNEFELAKQYCKDSPVNMNIVLTKQAEHLFNSKKYVESAVYYAQTQNSFEEICLKYLELGDFNALRTFLSYKLKSLDPVKEITQTTVVIAYIIEIYLNQLADLSHERLYDEFDALHSEFYKFLDDSKVKTCLKESKEAIYKIFASHGNTGDLVYFAEVMKDYAQIIVHFIQEENYRKALEALAKQSNPDVVYKYSPIFFEALPKDIVELWIKMGNSLNPTKLMSSLASCSLNDQQVNESIRYLEYCVNRLNSADQSIHDKLLTLYMQYKPEKLLDYVKQRKDDKEINFDELMLARLCSERSNKYTNEACVYLYARMGWYEEAVELALNVNVDLAREVANSVSGEFGEIMHSDELKKALWLRIARHVIEKENDVNKAMKFLQELTETIAIEDVLPYFPEFVTIDQFKEAIRTSLASYTERINSLKENIEQAAKSAQLIRRDIQLIRQKSITVNTSDLCSKCKFRLMTRRFYVFPCMHKFHSDCLYQASAPYFAQSRQKRIEELHRILQDIPNHTVISTQTQSSQASSNVGMMASAISQLSKATNKIVQQTSGGSGSSVTGLAAANTAPVCSMQEIISHKTELDELLANECPWCGERILRSIDEPFIDPHNYKAVYNSWL